MEAHYLYHHQGQKFKLLDGQFQKKCLCVCIINFFEFITRIAKTFWVISILYLDCLIVLNHMQFLLKWEQHVECSTFQQNLTVNEVAFTLCPSQCRTDVFHNWWSWIRKDVCLRQGHFCTCACSSPSCTDFWADTGSPLQYDAMLIGSFFTNISDELPVSTFRVVNKQITIQHGVMPHKTVIFMNSAVKTSNHTV